MKFTSQNVDDIRRYYCDSFLKFKETGDQIWYLEQVNEYEALGRDEKGDVVHIYLDEKHPFEVDYVLPHKSYFQYEDVATQLFRIPAQQYWRGINSSNTQMMALGMTGPFKITVDFKTLKHFVHKQKFFTIAEALSTTFQSVALSPRVALVRHSGEMFIDNLCVGSITSPSKITMKHKLFSREIKQLVQQNVFQGMKNYEVV
jgi:hypothetical protein